MNVEKNFPLQQACIDGSEHRCAPCDMRFKRKDNFLRHMGRQHPMMHVVNSGTENHNSTKDSENDVETLTESIHTRGGLISNETSSCITEEEALSGNLKEYHFPARPG